MFKTAISAFVGLCGGVAIERYNNHHNISHTLHAAEPFKSAETPIIGGDSSVAKLTKLGFPSADTIRTYDDFILSYNRRNRCANWVMEHLNRDKVSGDRIDRSKIEFFEDVSIHEFFRANNLDFKGSGYDR